MFRNFLIILGIAIILLISFSGQPFDRNSEDTAQKANNARQEIYIKNIKLVVDIADEPHEQTRGLSGREYMNKNEGMIFIFSKPTIPAFWMKEMRFALDMIWIDADNTIIGIQKNVLPETFPVTFTPASSIKYVLEVNAGWSDKNNIGPGDKLIFNN